MTGPSDPLLVTRGDLAAALRPLWDYVLAQTEATTLAFEELRGRMPERPDPAGEEA